MNKICVYTCITGDYDNLKPISRELGVDYICFTNNRLLTSKTWDIVYIDDEENIGNIALARKYKIIINDYIKEKYDISVWVDGAVVIRGSIIDFLETKCNLKEYDMVVFNHSVRSCVYEEAAAIVKHRKEKLSKVKKTIEFLEKENFPKEHGLTETTVLVRKNKSSNVDRAMKTWFKLLLTYSIRDQLTFDYSVYKTNLDLQRIDENVFDNKWFGWETHNKKFDFDLCRVYFDEYHDVHQSILADVPVLRSGNLYSINISIDKNCKSIELHLGTLMAHKLVDLKIISDVNVNVVTNCCIAIDNYYILGNDPLLIKLVGTFEKGTILKVSFSLVKIITEDWALIFDKLNMNFINLINDKDTRIETLEEEYNKLKNRRIVKIIDKMKRDK